MAKIIWRGLIHPGHVSADHAPAFRKADPGLTLPPDSGFAFSNELQRRGREVITKGCDDKTIDRPGKSLTAPSLPKGQNLVATVEVLARTEADSVRTVPERP